MVSKEVQSFVVSGYNRNGSSGLRTTGARTVKFHGCRAWDVGLGAGFGNARFAKRRHGGG
jgi:hypothetical protein